MAPQKHGYYVIQTLQWIVVLRLNFYLYNISTNTMSETYW